MKRNRREVVSRPNIRYCLYDDCRFPLEEGNYLCIEHGVKAIDDWCYYCKAFTKYEYSEDQTYSMGVAGSTNPRWSQKHYAFGLKKCIKCSKTRNHLFFLWPLGIIMGFPILILGLYSLPETFHIPLGTLVLLGLIIFYIFLHFYMKNHERANLEISPKNPIELKIIDELKKSNQIITNDWIKLVISHIKGDYLRDSVKSDLDRFSITLKEYNKTVKPIIEKELELLYAPPMLGNLTTKQIKKREKFQKKKTTVGSFEEWKKTNADGSFDEYREFFNSK
jgi:hypothetical protein